MKRKDINNLPFNIKHVLMHTRTHLAQSNELDMCILIEPQWHNACSLQPLCHVILSHASELDAHDN